VLPEHSLSTRILSRKTPWTAASYAALLLRNGGAVLESVFLSSSAADFITGTTLAVDGGYSARG
jgi:hypothetical protein